MRIKLSEHFSCGKLFRFVLPSVVMMIFMSVYGVVDGLFVSNFAGKTAFAAVNLIMPFPMALGSVGFMIGTGGSALVAKTLGEGDEEKANRYFSMLVYATILLGVFFTVVGQIVLRPVAVAMKATPDMIDSCVLYGRILVGAETVFMLQNVFQSFFVTAEKPKMGLFVTVAAGTTNIALDALFVAVFKWGVAGAAVATLLSQAVGGAFPLVYFARKNDSLLRLVKAGFYGRAFFKACTNGSSELMTNLSTSIVSIAYNFQLMKKAGENGVAAYGVIMYVNFIFVALFIGYSVGVAPIVGYHDGTRNFGELKSLFKKSLAIVGVAGALLTGLALGLSLPLSRLFVGYDEELCEMTCRGFRLYSLAFLAMGFNVFGSAFFTALNDGVTSAVISFLRTLVFQLAAVFILPLLLGIDGIWLAVTAAELLTLAVTVSLFAVKREKYHYM